MIRRSDENAVFLWVCTKVRLNLAARIYLGRAGLDKISPSESYPQVRFKPRDRVPKQQIIDGYAKSMTILPPIRRGPDKASRPASAPSRGRAFANSSAEDAPVIGEGLGRTEQIGEHLFVTLIKVGATNGPYPRGKELSYEIYVLPPGSTALGEGQLLLDPIERTLVTIDGSRTASPSFELQDDKPAGLRAAFGSCRKFHGDMTDGRDNPDMTERLFERCYAPGGAGTIEPVGKRPNTLFLLGDQIYADDVSDALIQHLHQTGVALVCETEDYLQTDLVLDFTKVGNRQTDICAAAGFTSTDGANHLATLGEYCAMYLMAFNAEIWPHYTLDQPEEQARRGSAAMRRILANTTSYMILDDHEITDDWNITTEWKRTVAKNPLGARIVTNGLIAYWFFQGWGNDPELDALGSPYESTRIFADLAQSRALPAGPDEDKKLLAKLEGDYRWSFIAPTYPPTLFLDTRFSREDSALSDWMLVTSGAAADGKAAETEADKKPTEFETIPIPGYEVDDGSTVSKHTAPKLVSKNQMLHLAYLIADAGYTELTICTPAPIFGKGIVDALITLTMKTMVLAKSIFSELELRSASRVKTEFMNEEQESWATNLYGVVDIFKFIQTINLQSCSILSGDVHFSFRNLTYLNFFDGDSPTGAKLHSTTSSGLKNPPNAPWLLKDVSQKRATVVGKEERYCLIADAKLAEKHQAQGLKEGHLVISGTNYAGLAFQWNYYVVDQPYQRFVTDFHTSGTFGYLHGSEPELTILTNEWN